MRRKNMQQKMMIFGFVAAGLIILALIIVLVLGKQSLDKGKQQIAELSDELTSNRQLVFVATQDIEKGTQITADNVMEQMIYTGLPRDSYITADNLGETAIVNIKYLEPVMANMTTPIKITQDMRRYEVKSVHLMTTQQENDVVDIRIMFPNGEDYLLFAKKQIMQLQMGTSIFTTYFNEDEILRMSSAMVDAYTTTGAKIYTTKYIEQNIQEEAIPNYLVKAAVLDLINSDPNIVEQAETTLNLRARNDLDQRLGALTDEQLSAVAAGLEIEDTAASSVIREGIMKAEQEQQQQEQAQAEQDAQQEQQQQQEEQTPEDGTLEDQEIPQITNEQPTDQAPAPNQAQGQEQGPETAQAQPAPQQETVVVELR